ncbi:MAG: zinc ribbon domain-containing protein [Euryarchaeota archaeon]|nr:zinc ribbon domain-containing protein [Euryarchaeota archaeon]
MEEKICPNCGRYVGSLEVCPYCGTKMPKHTSYYYAKYGSLTFAVLGIIVILVLAQNMPVQYVQIKDIGPTYNYALVEIRGIISSAPSLVVKSDGAETLYINIDDGTGSLSVHVYNPVVDRLAKANKIPGYGDFVTLKGELYFRGSNRYMIVNAPEQIQITRQSGVATNVSQINNIQYPGGNYMRVKVVGHIVSYRVTSRNSYVLNFTDGSGYTTVYIPSYLVVLYHFNVDNYTSHKIMVCGALEWYGSEMSGSWEIIPGSINDMRVVS